MLCEYCKVAKNDLNEECWRYNRWVAIPVDMQVDNEWWKRMAYSFFIHYIKRTTEG